MSRMGQPDIIFILPDQLRRDACGAYGATHGLTPNIDRMAAQGLNVNHAISSCPVCTPYRGMLMTGKYPTHSGVVGNFVQISARQNPRPLAKVLGEAGYETAYFGKWHLGPGQHGPPSDHPEFVPPGELRMGFDHWQAFNFHAAFNDYWYYRDTPAKCHDDRYETDAVFGQAIDWLSEREGDGPVFMVLSPHPPHPPFRECDAPPGYLPRVPQHIDWSPNVTMPNPRNADEMRVYLAMVANLDDNVGRLLNAVDNSARADNTLVIFTSDHGEMHGSHGRIHKMVPYAEALDVPLIMRWPKRIAAGRRADVLLGPMDWLPTLAAIAGAPEVGGDACGGCDGVDGVDGEDLSAELLGQRDPTDRQMLIANYSSHWNEFRSDTPETASDWRCWPEWRGVRTQRYTYVRWLDGREELFDNHADPFQQCNMAMAMASASASASMSTSTSTSAPILSQLRNALTRLLADAHDQFPPGTAYADWYSPHRELVVSLP